MATLTFVASSVVTNIVRRARHSNIAFCTTYNAIPGAFEMFLATFFFSFFLPFWSKRVSRVASDILSLYHEGGERNTVIYERMQFTINFLLDITRFVYGRGVLFSVSRIEVFFLLITKDIVYQFWHFGFK